MALPISETWRLPLVTQTVTLLYLLAGVVTEEEVIFAVKTAVETREVTTSPGMMEASFARFHLWEDHLSGVVPMKGNRIRDEDGAIWHIDAAQKQFHGERFRCEARLDR